MEIKRIKRKLDLLEARALNVTSQLTGMPRGGTAERDAVLAALADAADEYYKRLAKAERNELEVLRFIDAVPESRCRIILKLRYIDCRKWSGVLNQLQQTDEQMSRVTMFRLHGKALNAARELYKEKYNRDEKRDS